MQPRSSNTRTKPTPGTTASAPTDMDANSLQGLLVRVRDGTAGNGSRVSLGDVIQSLGSRTYAPLLVVLGLVIVSPVGDIPGASALLGLVVALVAVQMLLHRRRPWLPRWALDRTVGNGLVERSIGWLEKPTAYVDRHLHPRLHALTGRFGRYVITLCCLFAALLLVPLEFMPGASTVIGSALVAFGIALATHDGLAALVAFAFTGGAVGLVVWQAM